MKRDEAFYKRLITGRLNRLHGVTPDGDRFVEETKTALKRDLSLDVLRVASVAAGQLLRLRVLQKRMRC